jgi:hypothetical protein
VSGEVLQQRAFILSSLRRLNVPISSFAYMFADQMIKDGWMPPLGSLSEVDDNIELKYLEFVNGKKSG